MEKLKTFFRNKDEKAAYEGLVVSWPCVDKFSNHLMQMLNEEQKQRLIPVIQDAITAYKQPYPFYMTDWERLAVYLIVIINFVTSTLAGVPSFNDLVEAHSPHRRMTIAFIRDTARKLSMELEHA